MALFIHVKSHCSGQHLVNALEVLVTSVLALFFWNNSRLPGDLGKRGEGTCQSGLKSEKPASLSVTERGSY